MRQILTVFVLSLAVGLIDNCTGAKQPDLLVKSLAEKRVSKIPEGALFWQIENFRSIEEAQAAAGPYSLIAESAGKIWLFTLSSSGSSASPNAVKIAEVGPIPRVDAAEYLLRINDASGPPGSITPIHSHPGSETYFVLAGQQSIRGTDGTIQVNAGQAEAGHGADQAMQISSSGTTDLHALVMFVVDADRPFSSPATFP